MHQTIKKYFLISCGLLSIVIGIIGAVLPILPTTPFLILALTCFANSSPRFHTLLINNRWFGPALQQWEANKSITRSTKHKAMLLIALTFSLSIAILQGKLLLQSGLFIIGSILLVFMWRLKDTRTATVISNKNQHR